MKHFALALTSLAAAHLTGCTLECTLIGCVDAIQFDFGEDDGRSAGEYRLLVQAGDRIEECSIRLGTPPPSGSDQGGASGREAGGAGGEAAFVEPTIDCEGDLPLLVIASERFSGFSINETLESLEVTISLDGDVLLERSFTPQYEESYPNGPACDRSPCRNAHFELELGPNG